MPINENLYKNITNPINKLVKETGSNLVDSVENAVVGNLSAALQRVGLGDGSNKNLLGNLGEQLLAALGQEIFGAVGREMNISSKSDIENNRGVIADRDGKRDLIDSTGLSELKSKKPNNPFIVFPPDLNEFYITLDFKDYRRPAPSVPAETETLFSISLPLPRTLDDRHGINYSNIETGLVGAIFGQGQNSAGGSDTDQLTEAGITAAAYIAKTGLNGFTISGEALTTIASQTLGVSLNPHMAVEFKGPSLRSHKMQWLLSPNNDKESETIRKITQLIRSAALPAFITNQKDGSANFNLLDLPMMCKMTLYPWGDESKFAGTNRGENDIYKKNMYTFKHCVIDTVNINYAPNNLGFFRDESGGDNPAPSLVLLEISFMEIEYFTADDFGRHGHDFSLDTLKAASDRITKDLGIYGKILAPNATATPGELNELGQSLAPRSATKSSIFGLQGNANSAVMVEYPPKTSTAEVLSNFERDGIKYLLYKTADGSWYSHTVGETVPNGEIIAPVDSLDNEIFDFFDVPATERNTDVIVGEPIKLGNDVNMALIITDGSTIELTYY